MANTTIIDIDHGFKDLAKALGKSGEVEIGYFHGEKMHISEDGDMMDLAEIAIENEFGTLTTPERSFMRSTIDENKDKIINAIAKEENKAIDGKQTISKMLARIGLIIRSMIQKKIKDAANWATPNAPSTIAKKGAGKPPLTDTGQMARFIDFKKKVIK